MIDTIVVNAAPGETRIALLVAERTVEVLHHRTGGESVVGNIYLGRVTRVAPGLNAAFVDIGRERPGFLNAGDARPDAGEPVEPIAACVHEGAAALVQVSRDAIGDKGPRLTMRPTIAGRHLVYMPGQRRISVSRRIADGAEQERLLRLVGDAAADDEGFTLRTAAAGAGATEILSEADALRRTWAGVVDRRAQATAPACLLEGPDPLLRALSDHPRARRVVIDSPAALAAARRFCAEAVPELEPALEAHRDAEPVFERFGVEAALEAALEARVALPSGGALAIEETEALCAIDVDTAGHTAGAASAAVRANLEAADEIGRQLRLRGIGGLVIIDFARMTPSEHRRRVIKALRAALSGDRDALAPGGFTRLGLVEMRRRRTRPSLGQLLGEPCGGCDGRGRRKSAQSVALEIARGVAREANAAPPGPVTVTAAPEVAAALTAAEAGVRDSLAEAIGRSVAVVAEPAYGRAEHHIDFG